MPGEVKNRSIVQVSKTKKNKSKSSTETENQEKFSKVLDRCLGFLFNAMANGEDIFHLLDPLISDTQCHMHSLLVLNILRKCYNDIDMTYDRIEDLEEMDKEILSYAVLFSLLKTEYKDIFGFTIYEVSIKHFGSRILTTNNREAYYLNQGKSIFNAYSVGYIWSVASEKMKEILRGCEATTLVSRLKLLPCYAGMHVVLDHMRENKWPIIISMVGFERRLINGIAEYRIGRNDLRFYEFRKDRNRFVHKECPNEREKNLPTIAFHCYSVTNNGTQEYPTEYDVCDLIKMNTASHIQLPANAKLSDGYENLEEYVESLYKNGKDFADEYNKHRELAKEYNLMNVRYARCVRPPVQIIGEETSFIIERRIEDAFFAIEHVCLSNYLREIERLGSLNTFGRTNEREIFNFDKRIETLKAMNKFVV